ncbi:hypothetical protein [Pleurocapsa sp. PCC 7319]|uniref:mechanosensitive ion channel family protein n=1 Tax=Pleurocapsa sp. PCC 7319 TaxID=118161 RepID=UPI0003614467|nr:hypothetical protein [Pleurocapsa sp. PCC 7319]
MEDSLEQFSGLFAQLQDIGLSLGLKIVVVIIIFFVGRSLAKFLRRFVKRTLSKTSIDPTIVAFASAARRK